MGVGSGRGRPAAKRRRRGRNCAYSCLTNALKSDLNHLQYLHHILSRYNTSIAALERALLATPPQSQVYDPHGLASHTIFLSPRRLDPLALRKFRLVGSQTGFVNFGENTLTKCGNTSMVVDYKVRFTSSFFRFLTRLMLRCATALSRDPRRLSRRALPHGRLQIDAERAPPTRALHSSKC